MIKRLILLICLLFGMSFAVFSTEVDEDEYLQGRIIALIKTYTTNKSDENISKVDEFKVEILSGDEKGKEIIIKQPFYKESAYNIDVNVGNKVVLYKDKSSDSYYIADIDRRGYLVGLFVLFSALIIGISKWKGVKALVSLIVSIGVVYNVFLPLITRGYSPILVSTGVALLASAITIFLSTGFSKKGTVAILGAVAGVVFAGVVSMYFSYKMAMTGFTTIDSLNFSELLSGIKMKEIISAGVILGSMGAVMDISMSISSALNEVKEHDKLITKTELFATGMRIGADVIGTMVNTLILAYIGSGILSTLFIYMQQDKFPMIRLLNFESIVSDILRAFSGSLGILVAVPITSYLACIFFIKSKSKN